MSAMKPSRYGSVSLPPGDAHAARHVTGSPSDPDVILACLPIGTPDYKRVLGAVLKKKNHEHSTRHKRVSFKTMLDRQQFLVSFFYELRHRTDYRNLDPRQLANRHVEVMVKRWVDRGLSTATIHNYLSFLRTFAGWIGKPGMVRDPAYYVGTESPHAHRSQVTTTDHSWTAHGVDIEAKIAEIYRFDHWVGMHLDLEVRFGMRGKEVRHFLPHEAVIHRAVVNPRDAAAFPEHEWSVRISHGTKGGRPRDVPLATQAQRQLLERAKAAVAPGLYVGRPGMTSSQNRRRYYYVVEKFGITKAQLGVVPHGLRHQYANGLFEADAGGPSPARGGKTRPPGNIQARRRVSRALGHNRERATTSYCGSDAGLTDAANDRIE